MLFKPHKTSKKDEIVISPRVVYRIYNRNALSVRLTEIYGFVVFADIGNVPAYNFDFKALRLTAILFIVVYDLTMYFIRKIS